MSKLRTYRVLIVATVALAAVVFALSGGAMAEIIDPGAEDPDEGPTLTDWDPQLVNNNTVDRYQVTIEADNENQGISLIRQRPQITSEVRQNISMNQSFGDAMNPEIVAFEGDGGALGDRPGPERIDKDISVTNNGRNVLLEMADTGQGAQAQARITSVTIEFDALSAEDPGDYLFDVDMEAQDTTVGQVQNFDTLEETGIAQVTVVDATPVEEQPDLEVTDLDAPTSASQDERQMEVTANITNTNTTDPISGDVVYGLQKDSSPAFDGNDLLTQTVPDVTVNESSTQQVTFFVDLTEEDEAINTGDNIEHGVAIPAISPENITANLEITDGPVDHFEDPAAPLNRTTGLIQTAVDISDDAEDNLVVANNPADPTTAGLGIPYGESVVVDVNNIEIRGTEFDGRNSNVAWVTDNSPVFFVDGAENTTITDFEIDSLNPENDGVRIVGGSNHQVTNNDIRGTNTGAPGNGVTVTGVTNPVTVSGNEIANKTIGVEFDGVDNGVVTDNIIRDNVEDGIYLEDSSNNNTIVENDVLRNGNDGVWVATGENNTVDDNEVADSGRYGIYLGGASIGADNNEVLNNDVTGSGNDGIFLGNANLNTVTNNTMTDNQRRGIWLESSDDNTLTDNTANENEISGISLQSGSTGNTLADNTANENDGSGISFAFGSDVNTLTDNTIVGNGGTGLNIFMSGGNNVSDSFIEDNNIGIKIEEGLAIEEAETELQSDVEPESVEDSGNTFMNDVSRNNEEWDFVIDTDDDEFGEPRPVTVSSVAEDKPVTNLNIGDSTLPDTRLSFDADNIRLRSVDAPEDDPADAASIGRYFEAEPVETDEFNDLEIAQNDDSFLNVSLHYENADVGGADQSNLVLLRFNGTAAEWQDVPGSEVDTDNNLVSANITEFSDFGAFLEDTELVEDCIDRRSLSRGEEDQECPFDRDLRRGETREDLDERSGRSGRGEHRDSATERRSRSR